MTEFTGEIKTETLDRTVKVLDRVVDEARVVLGKKALKCRMADAANVGMVDIELVESDWERYEPEGIEAFGVNVTRMKDIVDQLEGETTTLEIVDGGARLRIEGDHLQFNMSLIDPQSIHQSVENAPDASDDVVVEVPGEEFRQGMKACDVLVSKDEFVVLAVMDGDFMLRATEDSDEVEYVCGDAGVAGDEARAIFSYQYLEPISKQVRDHYLTIYLKTDHPVFMDFAYTESGASSARYTVAPRIENE